MAIPKEELLAILADGRTHSGSELGRKWGVSRTSISKAVAKLDLQGLEIFTIRGKGYRLKEPLYLLDKQLIHGCIQSELQAKIAALEIFPSLSSTNTYLLDKPLPFVNSSDQKFHVCMSETQLSGRGSRGRRWVSPYGHNIYLSLSWKFSSGSNSLDGLSLVAGLAVAQTLNTFGIAGVGLKWPNDLQIDSKKVGGVLVEVRGEAQGIFQVVIGVGINLNLSAVDMNEVDQPWSCLAAHGFDMKLRNKLASQLITSLVKNIETFQLYGFASFQSEWSKFDVIIGKEVEIVNPNGIILGRSLGVDRDGALKVDTLKGVQTIRSGYLSLRVLF